MKFMINWQMHEDKLHETLSAFSAMSMEDEKAMMGDEVKLIGRWHDLVRGTGVAIFEAENAAALSAYALRWNRHMDFDIAVVLDDDEARLVGQNQQLAVTA